MEEVAEGVKRAGGVPLDPAALPEASEGYCTIVDRRDAIAAALGAARPGDTVLLAGKGHETYQIIGAQRHRFDDREEARSVIANRGGAA